MSKIGPLRKNDQQVQNRINELSTPSNLISTRPSAPSSSQTRRQAKMQDTAGFTDGRKVSGKSFGMKMGSKEIDSPSTFSTKQAAAIKKAPGFKNKEKAEKRATKMAHIRNKGTDAIKSGNQAKAQRLRKRYDRQKNRLSKS